MAWFPISNIVPQYIDPDTAKPFSGAVLKAYKVNTLTVIPFSTDNTGTTTASSVALNASGNPEVSGNVIIPHLDQDYKLALYPDQDSADADSGALWTIDDLALTTSSVGFVDPEHATDTGTDTYESASDTSTPAEGTEQVRDFQSLNTTTTPTLDGITLKDRDGDPLWPGALDGAHRLYYDGKDYRVLDLSATDGVVDPEHATDSATDTYDSATNTTPPADGVVIIRDFQSASTTTTPTLDGKTITDRDGSALWASAISGPHTLQRDQTADTYLLLYPRPTDANVNNAPVSRDANGRAKFADPSAAQDAVTYGILGAEKLSTGSFSGASVDISLPSGYAQHILVITGFQPATDGAGLVARLDSVSAADSYETQKLVVDGGSPASARALGTGIGVCDDFSTATDEIGSLVIEIDHARDASLRTFMQSRCRTLNSAAGAIATRIFSGQRLATEDDATLNLFMSSGNISQGSYTLYGMR